jgi:hypothetical protein
MPWNFKKIGFFNLSIACICIHKHMQAHSLERLEQDRRDLELDKNDLALENQEKLKLINDLEAEVANLREKMRSNHHNIANVAIPIQPSVLKPPPEPESDFGIPGLSGLFGLTGLSGFFGGGSSDKEGEQKESFFKLF